MRLPIRKSQLLRQQDDEVPVVTSSMVTHWKEQLRELEQQRPRIVEDLSHALSLGDYSENAEYQDAKHRLSRIDGRIFSLTERIKRAVIIPEQRASDVARLGSTVVLRAEGTERTYHIVGPHETHPSHGRISHVSPLGQAVLNHGPGETVVVNTPRGEISYEIISVS